MWLYNDQRNAQVQSVYKRMVGFQKLTINLFLTLHGQNVTVSIGKCPRFLYINNNPSNFHPGGSHDTHPHDNRIRPI
jgi:hypothetical protein